MLIEVIFEHEDFVVINKPPTIAVQDEEHQRGLLPLVCLQLGIKRLWLVHRLDKITSGLLILAKKEGVAAQFGYLFENHLIEKYYLAVASKKPKKKQGTVSGGMKKVRDGMWILNDTEIQRATTQFFSYGILPNKRLFLLRPLTGKTHQIRVMMKSLGSPILGDRLYKGEESDRTHLHAFALKFMYQQQSITLSAVPKTGQVFTLPETQEIMSTLRLPWSLNWPNYKTPSTQSI